MGASYKVALVGGAVLVAFCAGFWYRGDASGPSAAAAGRKVLYWHDPMHPSYKSDKPGIAPDCGMQLEPVYAASGDTAMAPAPGIPGAVTISAERQQAIGVRVGPVERRSSTQHIRLLGRVIVDEAQIYRIFGAGEGWVREVWPSSPGTIVQKDDLLAVYFIRDIQTPLNAYLYALSNRDKRPSDEVNADQTQQVNNQLRVSEEGLINLGMSQVQIREVARTRTTTALMQVRAPEAGVILARNLARGLRIDRSLELYRIADISHVWVLADLHGDEANLVPLGTAAQVSFEGHVLPARISKSLPLFDAATRTMKVRLELGNPGFLLRPDMFVDVDFSVTLPKALAIPGEAVLDSGLRKTVFVDRGNGYFEPRAVETGWRFGGRVEIVRGLEAGERIVLSGNFLIDSESRMQAAGRPPAIGATTTGTVKDPSCGMELDPVKAAGKSEYHGKTYYFCSKSCQERFDENPKKYSEGRVAKL
jgi:YHS domain-containing protein/multidrug efflux pump subunit AcrA (membrane-fusion protein)